MDEDLMLSGAEPPEPVMKRRADAMRRADHAWRARVAGATWQDAATIAGYANGENAIRAVRQVYGTLPAIERAELRQLWRDRLELAWRQSARDVAEQRLGAITAAVRVASAACALDGLNEPARVDVLAVTTTLESLTKELISHL